MSRGDDAGSFLVNAAMCPPRLRIEVRPGAMSSNRRGRQWKGTPKGPECGLAGSLWLGKARNAPRNGARFL
jgi:hypothetical protein